MGFLSILGKIGGLVAAPFTGGASLAIAAASLGTDVIDTLIQKGQISKAVGAQIKAIQEAQGGLRGGLSDATGTLREGQREGYDAAAGGLQDIQGQNAPYSQVGQEALYSLASMGPNQYKRAEFQFDPNNVQMDPGFKFRMDEAMKAINRSAAGRGRLYAGGTLKELQEYAQGLASNEYDRAFGRQFDTARAKYGAESEQNLREYNQGNDQFERQLSLAQFGERAAGRNTEAIERYYSQVMGLDAETARAIAQAQLGTADNIAELSTSAGAVRGQGSLAQGRNVSAGLGNIGYDVGNLISLGSARRKRGNTVSLTE